MSSVEELIADDLHLRGTVLTVIALFGLGAFGVLLNCNCDITFAAIITPQPTKMTDSAGALWSCGFVLAAIPMAISGLSVIPKTSRAYAIALVIALILCCRRSPVSLHPNLLEYVNWPNMLCFVIPLAGTFAAGALIRYGLWLIHSGTPPSYRT